MNNEGLVEKLTRVSILIFDHTRLTASNWIRCSEEVANIIDPKKTPLQELIERIYDDN